MRYLIGAVALTVALAATAAASAGGWASVGLGSLPKGIDAGETWRAEITVLRHGMTPTDDAAPSVTIRNVNSGESKTFAANPTGETGKYVANVVFPEAGSWSYEIDNGLVATGYGESAVTTYSPVTIAAAGGDGGDSSSFPVLPVGVATAAALALVAAGLFGIRRLRRWAPG